MPGFIILSGRGSAGRSALSCSPRSLQPPHQDPQIPQVTRLDHCYARRDGLGVRGECTACCRIGSVQARQEVEQVLALDRRASRREDGIRLAKGPQGGVMALQGVDGRPQVGEVYRLDGVLPTVRVPSVKALAKTSVKALGALMATRHAPVPAQAPVHPLKLPTAPAVAVRVTVAPLATSTEQVIVQVITRAGLVNVPLLLPVAATERVWSGVGYTAVRV
jgi:hypothetical protein